ncbi:MAG TPA: FixH family protein [Ktedonobacteraceae bacterium]|nr:FixH family protein [Ktedonobacteraceae bacterium]
MRRGLLVIALGVGFLIAITWLATYITNYVPQRPTPQTSATQVGTYDVTLHVDPNPPSLDQPATLSISLSDHDSHKTVDGAQVIIDGRMEDMEMDALRIETKAQSKGTYIAHFPFNMQGLWQLQVLISRPGQPTLNTLFSVMVA